MPLHLLCRSAHLRTIILGVVLGVLAITGAARADNVTINRTFGDARCIVHELADDADKAAAVRYIESFREQFFGGLEVIDATTSAEDDLREKLAGGFILFASFSDRSRLLPAAVAPLQPELQGDSIRLRGVDTPVTEARLICVGKNPYSDGRVVVYAAGSNRNVTNINGLFHGPRSYHLYRGRQLLSEGDYSEAFEFARPRLTLAEATEDVVEFFASLERIHPDLLGRVTVADYVDTRRWVIEEIGRKLDGEGTIALADFASALYRVAAFFGDGHTSLAWTEVINDQNAAGTRFPPFALEFRNGRWIIAAAIEPLFVDAEVTELDGIPVLEFLGPILDRCSGEILPFRATRFVNKQAFWWWLTGRLDGRESISLTTRTAGDQSMRHELATVGYADFAALERAWHDRRQTRRRSGLTYFDDGRIACFAYPAFVRSDGEKSRIDGVFRKLAESGVEDLIIDIRGNGGGNSTMGDFIFTYLTDQPFRAFSKVRVRLSRDVLAERPSLQRYSAQEGLVITNFGTERQHARPEHSFEGRRVMLLVDNATFSSATDFAVMFRDYEIGEIVGYETGGLPTSFGDVFSVSLTHSRIPYGVSYKQFFGPRPRPGDDEHGVTPDVPVTDDLIAPFARHADPVLALAIDRLVRTRTGDTKASEGTGPRRDTLRNGGGPE